MERGNLSLVRNGTLVAFSEMGDGAEGGRERRRVSLVGPGEGVTRKPSMIKGFL